MSALPQIQVCEIIPLPGDIPRFREALAAVKERGKALHADGYSIDRARQIVLREMQAGRSSAAAVALANGYLSRTCSGSQPLLAG